MLRADLVVYNITREDDTTITLAYCEPKDEVPQTFL